MGAKCSSACRQHLQDCSDAEAGGIVLRSDETCEEVAGTDSAIKQLELFAQAQKRAAAQGTVVGAGRKLPPQEPARSPPRQEATGVDAQGRPHSAHPSSVQGPLGVLPPPPWEEPLLHGVTVIFDWDDTLLPTSFFKDMPKTMPNYVGLPLDRCPFYGALIAHAELVREVLAAAASESQVCIVTLSARPWVHQSADAYLPGLNIEQLLEELDIPIYYACEYLPPPSEMPRPNGEECLSTLCKRNAMTECLMRLQLPPGAVSGAGAAAVAAHDTRPAVMSVGDSVAEQQALKDVCSKGGHFAAQRLTCKTVKLIDKPTLVELGDELRFLTRHMPKLTSQCQDFDLWIDSNGVDNAVVVVDGSSMPASAWTSQA